jgi:hypothetical protein
MLIPIYVVARNWGAVTLPSLITVSVAREWRFLGLLAQSITRKS